MLNKKKLKEIGFPDNLMLNLLNIKDLTDTVTYKDSEFRYETPPESEVIKVLKTLTEREEEVIYKRFKEFKSFEEIANDYSVTRGRIRQIEAKALRKLRYPTRLDKLIYVKVPYREIYDLKNTVSYLKESLPDYVRPVVLLDDLNLSVRPYNCLKRLGVHFAREILDIDLRKVHNLGRRSLLEVVEKMVRAGFEKEMILAGYLYEIIYLDNQNTFNVEEK